MTWDDAPPPRPEDRVDLPPPSTWQGDLGATILGAVLGFLLIWSFVADWWH